MGNMEILNVMTASAHCSSNETPIDLSVQSKLNSVNKNIKQTSSLSSVPLSKKRHRTHSSENERRSKQARLEKLLGRVCYDDRVTSIPSRSINSEEREKLEPRKSGIAKQEILAQNSQLPNLLRQNVSRMQLDRSPQAPSVVQDYINSPGRYFNKVVELQGLLQRAQLQALSSLSPDASAKDAEALLGAVQKSQMLYFSFCCQLLNNLKTQHLLHQQLTPSNGGETKKPSSGVENKDLRESTTAIPEKTAENSAPCISLAPSASPAPQATSSEILLDSSPPSAPSPSMSPNSLRDAITALSKRRAPRALTGKHVRTGTGASPVTLFKLREKLMEKQCVRVSPSSSILRPNRNRGRIRKK